MTRPTPELERLQAAADEAWAEARAADAAWVARASAEAARAAARVAEDGLIGHTIAKAIRARGEK